MSQLAKLREELNITQEELAVKANVSVRTIQRIEAGAKLKGYTLESISNVLGVSKDELNGKSIVINENDKQLVKLINLSSLPFVIVPFASIIVPLIIMFLKKKFTPITKQIISVQILWTILSVVFILLSVFLKKWFSLKNAFTLIIIGTVVLFNVFLIIRNAMELDRNGNLKIRTNFNLI